MKKIKKRKLSNKSQKRTSQNHPYTVSPLALPFFSIIFDINYSPFKIQSKRQRLSNISTPQSTSLQTSGRTWLLSIASAILLLGPNQPWSSADRRGRLYFKWARHKGYHLNYKAAIKQGQAFKEISCHWAIIEDPQKSIC